VKPVKERPAQCHPTERASSHNEETIMTSDNYTSTERRRLQELSARQNREDLPPAELAELNRLERRQEAEYFCEAIYAAMGSDFNIEQALNGVYEGLMLAGHDRVRGLKLALQAALDEPDALMAAVRLLLQRLEADDGAA
jgi:hypothetical protein